VKKWLPWIIEGGREGK